MLKRLKPVYGRLDGMMHSLTRISHHLGKMATRCFLRSGIRRVPSPGVKWCEIRANASRHRHNRGANFWPAPV
jgi:hypothetical protein